LFYIIDVSTMKNQPLLQPTTLGDLQLKNRMVLAPMTRNRAGEGLAPIALNAEYYRQRSTAGLVISEATQVSPMGMGYPTPPASIRHSK
jgi:N-ethylmaleimide reductase